MNKNVKLAKEILKIAKKLIAATPQGGNEEGFDESELKGLVSDISSAGDQAENAADDLAEQAEDIADAAEQLEESGPQASIFYVNKMYASMYYSKHLVAGKQYYKANALAEEVRIAAIKVAKYLKKASVLRVAVGENMKENFDESRKEWNDKTKKFLDSVKAKIEKAIKFLMDKINAFVDYVKSICQKAKDAGKETLGMLAKAGLVAATAAVIAIVAPVTLAVYGIVKAFGIAKGVIEAIFQKIKDALIALKDAIAKKVDDVLNAAAKVAGATVGITDAIIDEIKGGVEEKSDEIE